ncbi:MAG: hypothetical protein FJW37_11355 [Acidobacteria bacterium]|nr:hypothetical protein [Acidobacteriota bacterium]
MAGGLAFTAAYTYSKALNYGDGIESLLVSFDRRRNYGPADWDRTHNFALSHLWQIPFGAGANRWNTGPVGRFLANWQVNGILRWTSGVPVTVFGDPSLCASPGNACLADVVATGSAGFTGTPTLGGGLSQFPEQFKVEIRGEAYNLTNTPQFGLPITNVSSPNFGQSITTGPSYNPRALQLALRLLF